MDDLLEKLNRLKLIPRTGWLLCGIPLGEVEDVAQHSFDVAAMTLLLSGELAIKNIDLKRALSMAILHDWPETLIGDIPYPARKHIERVEKERAEESAMKDLVAGTKSSDRYMELWREYRDGKTAEAKLVHMADYLSIMVQALKYRERGNVSDDLKELWSAVLKDLSPYLREFPGSAKIVKALDGRFKHVK
ncbi:MAG: HD family hydrolase [Candidatus Hadarchaeales archaeon]